MIAGRLWTWILDWVAFDGMTLPWRAIYIHPREASNVPLMLHEMAHIGQIERDGPVMWSLYSVWYPIRYGYWQSPHEIEARAVSACLSERMSQDGWAKWSDNLMLMAEVRSHMGLTVAR